MTRYELIGGPLDGHRVAPPPWWFPLVVDLVAAHIGAIARHDETALMVIGQGSYQHDPAETRRLVWVEGATV